MVDLLRHQRRFVGRAFGRGVDTAGYSMARGEGKSELAAWILERCLTPGHRWNVPGSEYLLGAASLEQARNVFRPLRAALEPTGEYRFIDSVTRVGLTHKPSNTRLRVMSSNAKTAFGIRDCPLAILDEPGAWETSGGTLMWDALRTAQGKPESHLRLIFVGTLAPAESGWWHDLVSAGSRGSVYIQALKGRRDRWDKASEIRRCNPLKWRYPESRRKLFEERDDARRDPRLKAAFMSYRLNVPTRDESAVLLTVDDWQLATGRPVGLPIGPAIVAVDLGGGRSWSAAVAIWQSGLIDAVACAPGIPDLAEQERRDVVPRGSYQRLRDAGLLAVAEGLHVQPPAQLWAAICQRWGIPVRVVCDRFRLPELLDVVQGASILEPRVWQWSDASADIRALRRIVRDGPLSVTPAAEPLFAESLTAAAVENDSSGNVRLIKKGVANTGRDDVAAALTLAAGAFDRAMPSTGIEEPRAAGHAVV